MCSLPKKNNTKGMCTIGQASSAQKKYENHKFIKMFSFSSSFYVGYKYLILILYLSQKVNKKHNKRSIKVLTS